MARREREEGKLEVRVGFRFEENGPIRGLTPFSANCGKLATSAHCSQRKEFGKSEKEGQLVGANEEYAT